MSLVSLILPIGKQYKLVTSKNATACLHELRANLKPKGFELEGRIGADTFAVYRSFKNKLRKLFSPQIQGAVSVQESDTCIQVVTAPNPSAASLINSSVSTLVGVAIGIILSTLLVPNMVPKIYAFLWTAIVPTVISIGAALISRIFAEKDSQIILAQLSKYFEREWQKDPDGIAITAHNTLPQQIMTGSVSCIVFVAIASCTNSMIEGCWANGQFIKVESFCRPAAQITEALLGSNNIVTEQCRFELAEALRAERPGRFREAETIYETNLEGTDSYLKDNKMALANNLFSLGRVLDQTGRHPDAEKCYRNAIANWEQSREVGTHGTLLAKALNRLSMVCLKEHNYPDAEKFARQALDIDTTNGAQSGRSIGEDLNDLALVYDQQEKYPQAKEFYEQAVDYKNKHLDPGDYSRATSLYNLAEIEKITGDTAGYAKHSAQAYAIWKKILKFSASYSPKGAANADSADASELEINYAENGIDNGVAVPDPMSCYLRIMRATTTDYERPHTDARFDGLRPYLGRE